MTQHLLRDFTLWLVNSPTAMTVWGYWFLLVGTFWAGLLLYFSISLLFDPPPE